MANRAKGVVSRPSPAARVTFIYAMREFFKVFSLPAIRALGSHDNLKSFSQGRLVHVFHRLLASECKHQFIYTIYLLWSLLRLQLISTGRQNAEKLITTTTESVHWSSYVSSNWLISQLNSIIGTNYSSNRGGYMRLIIGRLSIACYPSIYSHQKLWKLWSAITPLAVKLFLIWRQKMFQS